MIRGPRPEEFAGLVESVAANASLHGENVHLDGAALPAHVTGARQAGQPAVARCSCTERTALDPSPTAAATRFIEPLRTSPTANTPGTDVSNGSGARAANAGPATTASGRARSVI